MKQNEWLPLIRGYNPENDKDYVLFYFKYPVKKTEQSILFKMDRGSTWVSIRKMRRSGKKIYVPRYIYSKILKESLDGS